MVGELDATEEVTFAAVGLALTRWEVMEAGLADLYSILRRAPFDRRVIVGFGQRFSTTVRRLAAVAAAADAFFPVPDQALEGGLRVLLRRVETLSIDRHRVAHGLVDRVTFDHADGTWDSGFALVVPWYSESRLRFAQSDAWPSGKIVEISESFVQSAAEARNIANFLLSPSRAH